MARLAMMMLASMVTAAGLIGCVQAEHPRGLVKRGIDCIDQPIL